MSGRLVVDFRVASAEKDSLFNKDWYWPIPQSTYDDSAREFLEWAYQFPAELKRDENLGITYELCESDILKDVASIIGTWIDVSTARANNLDLVFNQDQLLYRMMDENQFSNYSSLDEWRAAGEKSLEHRSRRIVRSARRRINGLQTLIKGRPLAYSISANVLSKNLTSGRSRLLRLSYADMITQRKNLKDVHPEIPDLAQVVSAKVVSSLNNVGHPPSDQLNNYFSEIILKRLINAWQDRDFMPGFIPSPAMTLFAGTGGSYRVRVVSNSFQRNGANVIRMTHGGENFLFDHPIWSPQELPFADTYVTHGIRTAEQLTPVADRHKRVRKSNRDITVLGGGSKYHSEILNSARYPSKVETVFVTSASFEGTRRAIPNVKLHDLVYYEWHRRLLSMVGSAGFKVISKRHPKGLGSGLELFGGVASEELMQVGMSETFLRADAFVMDIASTAMMEAICTLKPVVLVDIPNRQMLEAGLRDVEKVIQIVPAHFDERNRVTVDPDLLVEAIRKPVNVESRKQFITDYLTKPDQRLKDLVEKVFS
ncbi:MAG: hypothetical protein FI699_09460 [SAR202 cluster bacterium]|nr:hypothetical protein [SAR202 cluster bacterium]